MLKQPKIVIIGAGVSGISAAKKLIQNGFLNTIILEAENRIGGRINTVQFGGKNIELGAQWCHGEDKNIVFNMVKDLNLLDGSKNTYTDLIFYTSSGEIVDRTLTNRLMEIFYEISYDDEEMKKETGSFEDYFLKSYREYLKEEGFSENQIKISEKMIDFFKGLTLCYDGAVNWNEISASGLTQYELCGGNPLLHWKHYGFQTLFDLLTVNEYKKTIPIFDKVKLNEEVIEIIWSQEDNKEIKIKCKNGNIFYADHVIITTSLGVLKETHLKMFNPTLPTRKQIAIDNLGFGVVNKIFLKFSKKWWSDDCIGFSFVWDDESKIESKFDWIQSVFGFYIIDSDPLTLMGWSVGEKTKKIENLTSKEILDGCMLVLNIFLNKYFEIPEPIDVIWSKWNSSLHFKGSYSFRSTNTDLNNTSAYELSLPIENVMKKPCILFAGEATHPNFYSTVHGALETGFREAERIINFYKNSKFNNHLIKTKVVIIGAGMAGLGAAKTFLKAGFDDFLILEATESVGGRINTVELNESFIELGAQWLHDTDNYLYKLAKENDLISNEYSEEGLGIYVRDDGYIFDDFLIKKIDFIIGEILEDCEKFIESNFYPKSVGDFLWERFQMFVDKLSDSEKELALQLYDWHVRFQVIDNSCLNLKQISAKDWGKYSCLGKNGQKHFNIKNGYKSLINLIIKDIPKEKIKLLHPVIEINYNKSEVITKCQFDRTIISDKVILTSSIGFLKQHLIKFEPRLPENVEKAVEAYGFHGMGKIFLVFKERWWNDVDGFQLIWRKNNDLPIEKNWLKSITGFDNVLFQKNVLCGWIGGEGVLEMEKIDEEIVGKECVDLLKRFLKQDIPYPEKTFRSTWTLNPYIKGGYSHTTPLCDHLGVSSKDLSRPVEANITPKVYFAGEAVHETHFSTTHGAFQSGEIIAEKLLDELCKHKL